VTRYLPPLVFAVLGWAWVLVFPLGLTRLDAGELGAAAVELGIAHPPGLPTFVTTRHLLSLLPMGDLAARLGFASVVAAALSGALGAWLCLRVGRSLWAAVLVPLALLASPVFGLHATTIEVYADLPIVCVGALAATLRARDGDARGLVALGLLAGLSLGHHAELRLFVLALGVVAALAHRRAARPLGLTIGAAVVGALVILQLPLRALDRPMRNWGDPSTPEALWSLLTGARIREAYAEVFLRFDPRAAHTFADQVLGPYGALGLGALGLGVALLRGGGHRTLGALALLVGGLDVFYATMLNPMGVRDTQNGVPVVFVLALGLGLLGTLRWAGPALAVGLAPAALTTWLALSANTTDRVFGTLTDRTLDVVPVRGVAFVASDDLASGAAFAQVVEGARPDVAVLVRQHVWDASSVGPVRARLPDVAPGWASGDGLAPLLRAVASGSPWLWEWARGLDREALTAADVDLRPAVPLFRGEAEVRAAASEAPLETLRATAESITRMGVEGDGLTLRRWLAGQGNDLGLARLQSLGAEPDARALAVEALGLGCRAAPPGMASPCTNLAVAVGGGEAALQALDAAVALAPDDASVRMHRAGLRLRANQPLDALEDVARALEDGGLRAPDERARALALRGLANAQLERAAEARADLEAAIALDPTNADARHGLTLLGARAGAPPR
jgi:hypothetical protein